MLSGLTILGNTGLELTSTGGNDEDSTIGLGGTGNHVLDEVTVSRGVNDLEGFDEHSAPSPDRWWEGGGRTYGNHELRSLELPEGNIDGDTTLTLSLEFVQDPG